MPHLIRYSYVGLFVLILACSFGFPFSKTLTLCGGGILASRDMGNLYLYMAVGLAGLVTADSVYFLVGYLGGKRILRQRSLSRLENRKRLKIAESRFLRHGVLAVFSARFTPYVRALVFVAAGVGRMPPIRFLGADILSALILVPATTLTGYFFSEKWDVLVDIFSKVETLLAIVFVLVLAFVLFFPWRKRNP
jgi:membrane protein DedA with SNARE-associated domain